MKCLLLACLILPQIGSHGGDWKIRYWLAQAKEHDGCVRYAGILKPNGSEFVPIEEVLRRLAKQSASTSR
jgi:hypothetical protein